MKAGQEVFLKPRGNNELTITGWVHSIGRTYYYVHTSSTVTYNTPIKIAIATNRDITKFGYGYNYTVYESLEAIELENKTIKLREKVSYFFNNRCGAKFITLDQLESIETIIDTLK